MSIYYESYIFVRSNNDKLEYIGPYSQMENPVLYLKVLEVM